jgi:hypothetical protein
MVRSRLIRKLFGHKHRYTHVATMKVKEVQRTANIAWSTAKQEKILLAAGMSNILHGDARVTLIKPMHTT